MMAQVSGICSEVAAKATAVSQPRAMPLITPLTSVLPTVGGSRRYLSAIGIVFPSTCGPYPPSLSGRWPVAAMIVIARRPNVLRHHHDPDTNDAAVPPFALPFRVACPAMRVLFAKDL